jgi:hypothetical protein
MLLIVDWVGSGEGGRGRGGRVDAPCQCSCLCWRIMISCRVLCGQDRELSYNIHIPTRSHMGVATFVATSMEPGPSALLKFEIFVEICNKNRTELCNNEFSSRLNF